DARRCAPLGLRPAPDSPARRRLLVPTSWGGRRAEGIGAGVHGCSGGGADGPRRWTLTLPAATPHDAGPSGVTAVSCYSVTTRYSAGWARTFMPLMRCWHWGRRGPRGNGPRR